MFMSTVITSLKVRILLAEFIGRRHFIGVEGVTGKTDIEGLKFVHTRTVARGVSRGLLLHAESTIISASRLAPLVNVSLNGPAGNGLAARVGLA